MNVQVRVNGGAVRDRLLAEAEGREVEVKDVDFTVLADSFEDMLAWLEGEGFRVWQVREDFGTVRAGVPEGSALRALTKDADFVWARVDGPSSDGRRPDWVRPGTFEEDALRRDFTVNALLADPETGEVFDFVGGLADLEARVLRFVGDAQERLNEDWLRLVRGLRFSVTKGFAFAPETWEALTSEESAEGFRAAVQLSVENPGEGVGVARERVRDELDRMLAFDTVASLRLFARLPEALVEALFPEGLRLSASLSG